jgi:hypothetical protein
MYSFIATFSVTPQTIQDSESLFPEMSPSRTQFLFTLRWDIPIHAYYLKVILYSVTRKVLSTFIFCGVFSCESTAAKAKSTALNLVTVYTVLMLRHYLVLYVLL